MYAATGHVPPAEAEPAMLKLDFTSNPSLRQVTTMLRRAWLLADPGPGTASPPPTPTGSTADPDRDAVQERLRAACEALGADITSGGGTTGGDGNGGDDHDDEGEGGKWDHDAWAARAPELKLDVLGAPVVVAGPGNGADGADRADKQDARSVVSPWREEIYEVYRHVFVDLWRVLVATAAGAGVGRYDPSRGDAVSVVVLPLPAAVSGASGTGDGGEDEKKKVERTAFRTDTFLFPVWVNPQAEVSFAAAPAAGKEEEEGGTWAHAWAAGEASTWTTGLWVREGRDVEITTRVVASLVGQDVEEDDGTGVAAVFVTGHCEQKGE